MSIGDLFTIHVEHGFIIQIFIAEILFMKALPQKKHFGSRFFGGITIYIILSIVVPNLVSCYVKGFFTMIVFVLSLFLWMFCYQTKKMKIVFCCVGALFMQNLSHNIEMMIMAVQDREMGMAAQFLLSNCVMLGVYLTCYLIYIRYFSIEQVQNISNGVTLLMLLVVSGFAFTMQYLFQIHQVNLAWFSYLSLILCDIFGFCIVFGILKLNGKDEEARELERLLEQEKRQLELLQNSMEIINIKAHDLKHYIDRVEVMKSENAESLDEIKEEIIQYESVCRTGNATLDIILMEKKLLCQKKDIHLSVIADGGLLSFLKPTEIASVLGNALDNAIEYEEKLNDPERRCIFLNISKKNGYVRIRVENYCEDFPQLVGGMPVTTKENRNFHGYGMKSIRYIVEKYHGNIRLTHENNFFVLIILIPVLET